jgi:MFS family permease
MLALLCTAELLGMSLWFGASAVSAALESWWQLPPSSGTTWLMVAVQLGFVAGTAVSALLNLADLIPAARYFAGSALLATVANVGVLGAPDSRVGLIMRFLTGVFLAGVYPPAMKMVATWFRAQRGLAIGTVVGALTVGKATPYLVLALVSAGAGQLAPSRVDDVTARYVLLATSCGGLVAALLILFGYRDGPYPFHPRPFSWRLAADVAREPRWRLATSGYLGHMWELYAFWTWVPAFVVASLAAEHSVTDPPAMTATAAAIAFVGIGIGGIGCVWGGVAADRSGRERLVILALTASGTCALLTPLIFGQRTWLVALFVAVWGFFVIADSAQFSALVTESVPSHAVGTALTLQTSMGFLLTTLTIQLVAVLVEVVGWQLAFPILAIGPVAGIAAIRRLLHLRRRVHAMASSHVT